VGGSVPFKKLASGIDIFRKGLAARRAFIMGKKEGRTFGVSEKRGGRRSTTLRGKRAARSEGITRERMNASESSGLMGGLGS